MLPWVSQSTRSLARSGYLLAHLVNPCGNTRRLGEVSILRGSARHAMQAPLSGRFVGFPRRMARGHDSSCGLSYGWVGVVRIPPPNLHRHSSGSSRALPSGLRLAPGAPRRSGVLLDWAPRLGTRASRPWGRLPFLGVGVAAPGAVPTLRWFNLPTDLLAHHGAGLVLDPPRIFAPSLESLSCGHLPPTGPWEC